MDRLERRLQVHFAALTAIGGLLLSSGEVGLLLPTIAVTAAIVSHLAVDRWQLFALPTPLAYVGMGTVAAYCMTEFFVARNNTQLTIVAQLLVLVLVVLLFQKKNIRVYEQVGVFCLLELVVAAVFNSALLFGLMLIPFALVGLRALVLLQALTAARCGEPEESANVATSAPHSGELVARGSRRLPRYGIFVLTPSVLIIAAFFFYALPRVGGGSQASRLGGRVTTGFDESLTLDQVGELLQNRELVMRLELSDRNTRQPYQAREPIYLRGQALETYDYRGGQGRWESNDVVEPLLGDLLPDQYVPRRDSARVLYDDVRVSIDLQPLTTNRTLFAVAPYYALKTYRNIEHRPGQWLLRREGEETGSGRFHYEFGTHAFSNGIQSDFLRLYGSAETQFYASRVDRSAQLQALTQFDPIAMPTIAREAARIAARAGEDASPYSVAKEIESFLTESGEFAYTLSLTEERDRSIDPIEEFMASYRRGHCQYFASAMVMMLRSLDIPARIVVGYRSDEYNPIGKHYVVRQLHAHSWVEVLLREDQVPLTSGLGGQPPNGPVLARFDPTPSSDEDDVARAGRVEHLYDFAQSLWNSYVLDMDGERQSETLFGQEEGTGVSSAYGRVIERIRETIVRINAGELGAGALANGKLFSWRGAVLGIIITLIAFGLYQLGLPHWAGGKWLRRSSTDNAVERSPIAFYQRLSELLAKAGLRRRPGQTPREFADLAARSLSTHAEQIDPTIAPALQQIIDPYYDVRYGGVPRLSPAQQQRIEASLRQLAERTTGPPSPPSA